MKNKRMVIGLIILSIIITLIGCEVENTIVDFPEDNLVAHFIDVGQGDSTLIEFPNSELALIDGGTRAGSKDLVRYIKDLKIEKIDYLIGTHPHEDHIGGLPELIRNFEIGRIYLPNKTSNTKIFEDLLMEIKNKDLKISEGKTGVKIIDSKDLKFYMIAPSREYSNINNNSIVTKVIYKDFSLIITGDAEKEAEYDMIEEGHDLKADILRIGHHGSSSSSTAEFISQVDPSYGIISLGKNNTYGHPHKEVLDLLEKNNINILRTDKLGDIIIQTDGEKLNIVDRTTYSNGEDTQNGLVEEVYIGNINSQIFHTEDCNSLPNKENQIRFFSREEALKEGYRPHSVCIK